MTSKIILETERLLMESVTPVEIHELFRTKTKDEIKAFLACSDESYRLYSEMHEKGMETNRITMLFFQIKLKSDKRKIGEFGFHSWNRLHRKAELYYFLWQDDDKQKGYMSEVITELLTFGFNQLNLHRIQACVADWNTPSSKLLLRKGFIKEGVLREDYNVNGINEDSICYSLLKREWES